MVQAIEVLNSSQRTLHNGAGNRSSQFFTAHFTKVQVRVVLNSSQRTLHKLMQFEFGI